MEPLDGVADVVHHPLLLHRVEVDWADQLRHLDAGPRERVLGPQVSALLRFRGVFKLGGLLVGHARGRVSGSCRMILRVCLVLFSIFFSVSFSSSNSTISLIDRMFFRSSSPIVSIALRTIGEREIVFSTSICPRSMRLAMATSP